MQRAALCRHRCPQYGFDCDRDHNAAINILRRAGAWQIFRLPWPRQDRTRPARPEQAERWPRS